MMAPFVVDFEAALAERKRNPSSTVNPFTNANALREPIFYGAEGAYSFQYRDLAAKKYARDEEWLRQHKGFTIEETKQVAIALTEVLEEKLLDVLREMKKLPPEKWTILDGFKFSVTDVVSNSKLSADAAKRVLLAFTFPNDGNPTFGALNEFNAANAYPLLRVSDDDFILFQDLSFTEAIYETPFYWMADDKRYAQTAMTNRGLFTEEVAAECLERVFGKRRVFRNVTIAQSKAKILGEIDTLVLFADRAIVVQAKSKRLTLASRKGNDLQLRDDFKGAVQDACDQAYACSQHLLSASLTFTDGNGQEIKIPPLKQIFDVCVVSDHYPALSFQVREFLKYSTTDVINAPLICDLFLLDVVTEMLETPLRCLSYLELRAIAGDQLIMSHEFGGTGISPPPEFVARRVRHDASGGQCSH
jgi:hypothetical protein